MVTSKAQPWRAADGEAPDYCASPPPARWRADWFMRTCRNAIGLRSRTKRRRNRQRRWRRPRARRDVFRPRSSRRARDRRLPERHRQTGRDVSRADSSALLSHHRRISRPQLGPARPASASQSASCDKLRRLLVGERSASADRLPSASVFPISRSAPCALQMSPGGRLGGYRFSAADQNAKADAQAVIHDIEARPSVSPRRPVLLHQRHAGGG